MTVTGAVKKLTRIQIAKEVTPGTGVACTARLLGGGTLRDISQLARPERDYGILDVAAEDPIPVAYGSSLDFESELSTQQLLYFLRGGIRKVSGVEQTGGQGDYLYTFSPIASSDPLIETFTIEGDARDGTAVVQNLKSLYNIVTELGIDMAGPTPAISKMTAKLMGRQATVATVTAGLGIPARTLVASQKWQCKVASALSGLAGASAITGGLVNFSYKLQTGLAIKRRANGSLDFYEHSFAAGRLASLQLTIDLSALAETERLNFIAGTAIAVRLAWTGATIGAGTAHAITIDGVYNIVDPPDAPSDDSGQYVQTFNLVGKYEAAGAKQFNIAVTTNVGVDPT